MQYIITIFQYILDYFTIQDQANVQQAIGAAVIPLITLAISAASTGYSQYKKGQANKKAQGALNAQNAEMRGLSSWYDAEASKDFMDTDVAKSTLSKIRSQYKKGIDTNASNIARGGGTVEAEVANKATLNEKYNDVLSNMVGYGTQYKQNMKKGYSDVLTGLYSNQNMANFGNAQGWATTANNAGQAFANTMGSTDWQEIMDKG